MGCNHLLASLSRSAEHMELFFLPDASSMALAQWWEHKILLWSCSWCTATRNPTGIHPVFLLCRRKTQQLIENQNKPTQAKPAGIGKTEFQMKPGEWLNQQQSSGEPGCGMGNPTTFPGKSEGPRHRAEVWCCYFGLLMCSHDFWLLLKTVTAGSFIFFPILSFSPPSSLEITHLYAKHACLFLRISVRELLLALGQDPLVNLASDVQL